MPGNRMNTSRALVCVGNMKGAAGFGKGKGKSQQDAINAAFRDALRNLYFIDLYDGASLYHDVHGKHNSCHAYIKATPKTRMMVGSPFACSILERFGINSASVKLVGRRLNVHFAKNGSTCLVYEGQSSKRQELRTKSTQMAA